MPDSLSGLLVIRWAREKNTQDVSGVGDRTKELFHLSFEEDPAPPNVNLLKGDTNNSDRHKFS